MDGYVIGFKCMLGGGCNKGEGRLQITVHVYVFMYEQKQDRNYWGGIDILNRTKEKSRRETNLMLKR